MDEKVRTWRITGEVVWKKKKKVKGPCRNHVRWPGFACSTEKNHVNFTSYGVLDECIAQVSCCSCDVLCHINFVLIKI